ncbi:MAG TPA: hypothetical protein VNY07_08425 [Chthoniobacterales bacterium]|nr:hypothetical protein [Chthoniobacterales bacterium]
MNKKTRKRETYRVPGGYPEIAHPNDQPKYERQLGLVYDWFSKMLERVEGDDQEATESVQNELQGLFGTLGRNLLRLALDKNGGVAKEWAGDLLGSFYKSIEKHDEKLCEANAKYVNAKKVIGKVRKDVLFPRDGISAVAQRELNKAEGYRKSLARLKAVFSRELQVPTRVRLRDSDGKDLGEKTVFRTLSSEEKQKRFEQEAKKRRIPQEYWKTTDLAPFSAKSKTEWWNFLWPLIRKNNPDLLSKLRAGKIASMGIRVKPRWASYRKEFRNHLKTLAHLRSSGVI